MRVKKQKSIFLYHEFEYIVPFYKKKISKKKKSSLRKTRKIHKEIKRKTKVEMEK